MSERQTIHMTKIPEFMGYLFKFYDAEIVKPADGEVFRVIVLGKEIGFAKKKNSDHLTTWGKGTTLANRFLKLTKDKTN